MNKYRFENMHLMLMQSWYGQKLFCLPKLHILKERAYRRKFDIGDSFYIEFNNRFYREHGLTGKLTIGSHCVVTNNVVIDYSGGVLIGNHVTLSAGTKIYSHDHDCEKYVCSGELIAVPRETAIEDYVWIGANAVILPGVKIGSHSVVGAGAVVTHDVPSGVVAAGNPARVIRTIESMPG